MSQSTTLSCRNPKLGQALSHDSDYALHVVVKALDQISTGRRGHPPASISNISLIDLDIDTSDFINMKSAFPWDENQPDCRHNDSLHPLRHSFESSSSTIQGSYWPMKTPLLPDTNEAIAEAERSRQSILIPDYPQDLASHHVETYKSRPADLRTSSTDSAIPTKITTRSHPSYKRSVTPSQLDSFAGALGIKSARGTHAPQSSFASNYSQDPLTAPSLAFSSPTASSPASSITYSRSISGDTLYSSMTNTACVSVLRTENSEKRSDVRPSGQGSMRSGPKQVQRRTSGPLPKVDFPSTMHPTISSNPRDIHSAEEAFQPRRKTPNPPPSIPLPSRPGSPATLAEPASWWDLDDDASAKSSKRLNLPAKLSIPHLRLRVESSTKKTIPIPAPTIKRRSEDSITVATNIVETPFQNGVSYDQVQATGGPAAHISWPSPIPNVKSPPVTLKKKHPNRPKPPAPASDCTMKTPNTKKGKMFKVGSSSQAKERFFGRRLRACFRRVFG